MSEPEANSGGDELTGEKKNKFVASEMRFGLL
jgi:hypothetical protein